MTGITATNENKKNEKNPNDELEKKLTDESKEIGSKKNSDSELQIISNKVETITKDLDTRLNVVRTSLIKKIELFFDFCMPKTFEKHIGNYRIVLQSVTSTVEEGKDKKESSSSIIFELTKIPLSVEPKDEIVKKQIKRSNTLKELYLSTGKSVAELEVIITHSRSNTVENHNGELVEQVQLLRERDVEKDKEMQSLREEVQELKAENTQIKGQFQLLAQQMSDLQGMFATIMGQNFNQQNTNSPSSSLSDSDIEMMDMPDKKHS